MQNFNYHTHTYRCGHADSSISDEEYVKLFVEKGFKKICFTDHCPQKIRIDNQSNVRMEYREKEEYYKCIRTLKEKYKGQIDIEVGFEVEYASVLEDCLFELKNETDKLILGQHFIYDDKSKNIKSIGWRATEDEDIINYSNHIVKAIELGIPNIIAHPDLYLLDKKHFGKAEQKVAHIICEAAEKYQIPLEINLSRACLYLQNKTNKIDYPNKNFWEIASNYNIKVLYGVDAHFREQINLYEECVELVKEHLGKDVIDKLNFVGENL